MILDYPEDNITSKSENTLVDAEWIVNTLNTNIQDYERDQLKSLYYSGVLDETMDTSLGGHLCLNPYYDFTPHGNYYKGRLLGRVDDNAEGDNYNIGMSRQYYEYIQSNSEVRTLALSFGIPEFQGILGYIMGSVDMAKMTIVNEGRSPTYYYIGKGVGTAAALIASPLFTASYLIISKLWNTVFGPADPRFYHMRPDMSTYYSSVNTMMQVAAAERGFTKFNLDTPDENKKSLRVSIDGGIKKDLHSQMPRIFNEDGIIDILKVSSRYQLLLNTKLMDEAKFFDTASKENERKMYTEPKEIDMNTLIDGDGGLEKGLRNLSSFIKKTKDKDFVNPTESEVSKIKEIRSLNSSSNEDDYKPNADGEHYVTDKSDWAKDIKDYYMSSVNNVSNNIFLQVEYLDSGTDSFNNTTTELPAKNYFNSTSSAFRDVRFTLAGTDIITEGLTNVIKNVRDVVTGVIDGASFGLSNALYTILGGGYVDMPLMWDNSSAKFAEHQFKIVINNPYGNIVSLLMDIDYVLYSLLAGMLPREMGRAAYGSPFLCKAFIPGKVNIDFGMITDLTVTRGSGNIGHNDKGAPLNIEIGFTITDFNELFVAPVSDSMMGVYNLAIDEYSMMNKYIQMISGTSYTDSKFIKRRAMIRLNALYGAVNTVFDVANLSFLAGSNKGGTTTHSVNNIISGEMAGIYMWNND